MPRLRSLLLCGLLGFAGTRLPADTNREFDFVVDNWMAKDVRVVVEERWADGSLHTFDIWIKPGLGGGFNLHDDLRNKDELSTTLVRMKLDNIDTNRWFNTKDMMDMFGNHPNKECRSRKHFLVENNEIKAFPLSRGKGR